MLRRLGRDVAIYGVADFAFRFVAFAVFPIYAHIFTVEQFGVYALVSATTGLIALLATLGINNAAQRYYWEPEAVGATQSAIISTGLAVLATWSVVIVGLSAAALFPFRETIAVRYGISWTVLILALATIVPEQILQYCLDTLRLHFAPWKFAAVSLLKNLLGVAASLLLVVQFRAGLEGLFAGALFGAVAAVPAALILVRRDLIAEYRATVARRLVAFGYPFIFAGLAYWIFGTADRWMLAEMSTAKELGLYAIAYKFGTIVVFLNGAFGQAWSPMAMKIRRDDSRYRAAYARVLSVWLFVLLFVAAGVALFGKEILRLLTPEEYWNAAVVLAILVMGVAVSGTTQITAVGISIEQKTRLFAWASWTTAAANVGLNIFLIPAFGAVGAALATFLSYVLLTGLYLFWSQRLHPIPLEKLPLALASVVIVAFVCSALVVPSPDAGLTSLLAKVLVLAAIAAGGTYVGVFKMAAVRGAIRGEL